MSATVEKTEQTSSIMLRLREETRSAHDRAESHDMVQLLARGELPRPLYVSLLGQRYLIHRALEQHIAVLARRMPAVAELVHDELLQEQNLTQDLVFFGIAPDSVLPLPATTAFISRIERMASENGASLLGVYYVFEGSKNGGRMIARSARQAYELTNDGLRYLDPHGPRQRELWMAFVASMDKLTLSAVDRDGIIEAAKATFDAIGAVDDELYAARP